MPVTIGGYDMTELAEKHIALAKKTIEIIEKYNQLCDDYNAYKEQTDEKLRALEERMNRLS